ncbi:large conductance mechanosensitive channel protein MscL [Tomitella biformata]|uniref:large conductance mechanosensitive channel protein MscL n=1 Tax=Tomitella biformata TaxID=630403 RepID=UPI0004673D69|nr:MscL family protein [Tomitella biformata]
MLKGFKGFLMQGEVIIIAVGLVVATAFSTLVKAFTDSVINPIIAAAGGADSPGLGVQLRDEDPSTFIDFGTFISAIIYFIIFMAVIYFVLIVPYRAFEARRGNEVFGDPAPTKACPDCLSSDLPMGATKCMHCGSAVAVA